MKLYTMLEFFTALFVVALFAIVSLELFLVRLSLFIISRTPVLRNLVPIERRGQQPVRVTMAR